MDEIGDYCPVLVLDDSIVEIIVSGVKSIPVNNGIFEVRIRQSLQIKKVWYASSFPASQNQQ